MNALVAQQVSLNPVVAGQYRYLYNPYTGTLYHYRYDPSLGVYALVFATGWVTAPKTVNVEYTDTLRITASFSYSGPDFSGIFYGAIGQNIVGVFDEIVNNEKSIGPYTETVTPVPKEEYIDIPITTVLAAGKDYAIYVKIMDANRSDLVISDYLSGAVHVVELVPTFTEFAITDYKVV